MCNTLFLFYCRQRQFFTKLEWTPRTSKTAKLTSRKQNVDMKTYTREQDKQSKNGEIGGRVARMLATVGHVNFLMKSFNQWSLSMALVSKVAIELRSPESSSVKSGYCTPERKQEVLSFSDEWEITTDRYIGGTWNNTER